MDALEALHSRNSINLLAEPGPDADQLDNIVKAGLRACDHKNLRPWRYLLIEGDARQKFGELMVTVKQQMDGGKIDAVLADKLRCKPLRAPSIMVVVAHITAHPKVPRLEQILSAGASAQMMMVAAHAQGLGAIWRSGSMMFHPAMRNGLELATNERIVGFIYIGTPKTAKELPRLKPADYLRVWPG